tara:strand:+ start:590 stop:835 length:246 start_codon:yes stop_codon:yes gene_type:complete
MSDDKIISFPGTKKLDDVELDRIDPKEMLTAIIEEVDLEDVYLIGWTKEGNMYIATSDTDVKKFIFNIELAKTAYLNECLV